MSEAGSWQRLKDVFDAALERPTGERAAFIAQVCGDDRGLHDEVRSLLVAHEQADGFLSLPALAASDCDLEGRRVGPYRVHGEIGHGGMGVVFRATRDDDVFHKTVALKVVHGDAGPEGLRRFGRERQILARLQHPNIATILDGGQTEQGRPYLVMEHIQGEAIDAFCASHSLGIRQRLELFRTVCGAVHYAHQNLIVHRDLKPANILVTADGQPKLLDFGIAALLEPVDLAQAPTTTLLPAMTPDYASPEQMRGLPLTTASDVYSLGVVAYELMTGQLPLQVRAQSLEHMVRTVCDAEPTPPSTAVRGTGTPRPLILASDLRGDLDTIVLKALRKDPARRYLSAQELAEDIGRYLAGRPVAARKDTLGYRVRKFVGRHRAGVAAAAVMLATVAGGVAAIVHQARVAETNRIRAEQRFGDVRKMANSLLFELHDAIKDLPGSTQARELVLRRALEYLDSLARDAGGDADLQQELATAYRKVAEVQGSPLGANLGNAGAATGTLRKEVALREALSTRSPGDRKLLLALLDASRRLAILEDEIGQTQAGHDRLVRDLRVVEALVAREPGADDARRESARAYRGLGHLMFKRGELPSALERQRRSLAIWKAETEANPKDAEALRELHLILGEVARSLAKTGAGSEALEHYRGAVAAAEARLELRPEDPVARRDVNNGYGNLAAAFQSQGDLAEAARYIAPALAFDEERLRADPRDSQAQRDVHWDLSMMAQLAFDAGRIEEALAYARRGQDIAEARFRDNPASFQAHKEVAEGWAGLAEALAKLDRLDEAMAMNNKAIADFETLRAQNPSQTRVAQLLAAAHASAGELYERVAATARGTDQKASLWRQARAASSRALEMWRDLERRGALDADHRAHLADMAAAITRCDAALARLGPH